MPLPGQPAPRPLAGPILPLVASSVGTDQLLGGPGSRPAAVDALAARTLVKGEPLAPPAGRADDFAWPRREVGREQAKGETPVASTAPDGMVRPGSAAAAAAKQRRPNNRKQAAGAAPQHAGAPAHAVFARFLRLRHRAAPASALPRRATVRSGRAASAGNVGRSASVAGLMSR